MIPHHTGDTITETRTLTSPGAAIIATCGTCGATFPALTIAAAHLALAAHHTNEHGA